MVFRKASNREQLAQRVIDLEKELAAERGRTADFERAFEALGDVSERVKAGDLEARVLDWDRHGDLSPTLANINNMLDLTDAFIREATTSLDCAANGRYYRKFLTTGLQGSFKAGAKLINVTSGHMEAMEREQRENHHNIANAFEASVMEIIETLTSAVEQIGRAADQLSHYADDNQQLATTVAAAAEQATMNVQTVATSTEELSASVEEIARQVNTSSNKTAEASGEAEDATGTIQGLKEASGTIDRVINLIHDIADQTNLLALNATIEAARAGDAGRGFAVVASEVKSLAQQTATATDEIGTQVQNIQDNTDSTVSAVSGISDTIATLKDIASSIAAATEQQSAATTEISRNIQEASEGTQQVASNIGQVSATATETSARASELKSAASHLSETVVALKSQSEKFVADVRNA